MLTIGIDVGGTAAKLALVDETGDILAVDRVETGRAMPGRLLLDRLAGAVRAMVHSRPVAGIGIGVPATVFRDRPLEPTYCNVPALTELDLAGALAAALRLPVWMENDAKAALRGEWRFGAARGARQAAVVTLGTGIGSALLLDGALRDGAHGNHGELGLTLVGLPGAWLPLEQWAAPGFARDRHGAELPALAAAAAAGDAPSLQALQTIYDHLGVAIANLHLQLDLEVVVLAGGMTAMGAALVDGVRDAFVRACPGLYQFDLAIRQARHGELAGAVGAAALAQMCLA